MQSIFATNWAFIRNLVYETDFNLSLFCHDLLDWPTQWQRGAAHSERRAVRRAMAQRHWQPWAVEFGYNIIKFCPRLYFQMGISLKKQRKCQYSGHFVPHWLFPSLNDPLNGQEASKKRARAASLATVGKQAVEGLEGPRHCSTSTRSSYSTYIMIDWHIFRAGTQVHKLAVTVLAENANHFVLFIHTSAQT